jgi:predicted Zn-dependent protease
MKTIITLIFLCLSVAAKASEPETAEVYFDDSFSLGPDIKKEYPSYLVGVEESGGYFNTAEKSWSVSSSAEFGKGWLAIQLDRSNLASDLALVVLINPYEDTDLTIQLFNDRGEVVAVDLFANIVESITVAGTYVCIIPLTRYPDASSIVIRRIGGRVEITGCIIFPVIGEVENSTEEHLALIEKLGDRPSSDYYNFLSKRRPSDDKERETHKNAEGENNFEYNPEELSRLKENLGFTVFGYDGTRTETDVYFIPLFGFPSDLANELSDDLEKELSIKIKVSVHMGISPKMYNAAQDQYDITQIAAEARVILKRISDQKRIPFGVILTEKDINAPPFNLRYNFAAWMHDISVVSTARMDPRGYGEKWDRDLLYSRLKKMVKKHVGYGFYNYRSSTDIRSVMYSPIMSLDGLDQIGNDY